MENIPNDNSGPFVRPRNFRNEEGEIRRVAEYFDEDADSFTGKFLQAFQNGAMIRLNTKLWEQLENTDSSKISQNDWDAVKYYAEQYKRDWESLKKKMEEKSELDAPIVLRYKNILHLVSGNTRLMVARAMGETPNVLLVTLD